LYWSYTAISIILSCIDNTIIVLENVKVSKIGKENTEWENTMAE